MARSMLPLSLQEQQQQQQQQLVVRATQQL
jgi:hypothetical protein